MLRSNTILLIEEDSAIRFMMREIARALDVTVETAHSCDEGLNWLRAQPLQFAMIILNLNLCGQGQDGTVQSIRNDLQADVRDIPIVGVGQANQILDDQVKTSANLDEYLQKPITPVELLALADRYFKPLVA